MIIPDRLKQFVSTYIDTPETAKVLMVIRREALRQWDAQTIGNAASMAPKLAEARLEHLASSGFLISEGAESKRTYTYEPSTPELGRIVNEFVHWYWSYPSAIIAAALSSRPLLAYGASKTQSTLKR